MTGVGRGLTLALALAALAAIAGCSGGEGTDGDADSDSDVDTDVDTDVDGDGDSDADGDGCEPGEPPVTLSCPESLDLGCVPASGTTADLGVEVSSCEDASPALECDPPEGSAFVPGETTVTCTATTAAGSEASCEIEVSAEHEGSFALDCPALATAECAGAATAVSLADPDVVDGCGTLVGAIASDAPAGGYAQGETTVTFSASGEGGFSTSCATQVRVEDSAPPTLTCPAAATVVRSTADAAATPPAATASDACEGSVAAAPAPASLSRGATPVTYTATDGSGHAATCTTTVTVLDAFAVEGLRIARARLSGGATSITLAWEPSAGADASGYRVERATSESGPFAGIAMTGASTFTVTDPAMPGTHAYYRVVTLASGLEGGATAAVHAYAIAAAGYDIRGVTVPTVGFSTTLYGVVRHPVDLTAGPYPLVAFLHGNHGNCRPSPFTSDDVCATTTDHECHSWGYTTTPNAEGLAYLAETLAAQGYVAFSISGNALNCRNDYIIERAELIMEHLRRWNRWATVGEAPFGTTFVGAVDMARVGLVGHSRGAEAVAHVPTRLRSTPISGVSVASVFSIAPTDYHTPTPAGAPYAVLLPSCDGDVYTLAGMQIYDRSLDPAGGEPRAQVLYVGANHNFFSTEWRYDDNARGTVCRVSDEVGDVAQQAMLAATLGAWMNGTVPAGSGPEPFLRADADTPVGVDQIAGRDLDLRWSYSSPERVAIDDFSGARAPTTNLLGLANTFAGYTVSRACHETGCDGNFWHDLDALMLSWDGLTPLATFNLGGIDATAYPYLSFRVTSRRSTLNSGITEQDFAIRAVDGDGTAVELLLSEVTRVPHLYPSPDPDLAREVLQTVRVPLDELSAIDPAFDATSLGRFELDMTVPGHTRGSVIVTDIDIAR